ncbi:PilZ domain-containing protein [Spirochaetota bacterium]
MIERREYPRKEVNIKIKMNEPQRKDWFDAVLNDISLTGACLEAAHDPPDEIKSNDIIIIKMFLIDNDDDTIQAVVKWVAKKGDKIVSGIKFDQKSISDDHFKRLEEIVKQ